MPSDNANRAFLTDIDGLNQSNQNDGIDHRLDRVRKDHKKLNDVIESFKGKVDVMVDKQRMDFMQAYEHHIFDIIKEINYLREKVNEVANDKARNEKMQELDRQQNMYKNEALALDVETAALKKKLRVLAGKIQIMEKERDWLLKKLRSAKSRLQEVSGAYAMTYNTDSQFSISSNENESAYTLDLPHNISQRDVNIIGKSKEDRGLSKRNNSDNYFQELKQRINQDFKISRDSAIMTSLPHLQSPGSRRSQSLPALQPLPQRVGPSTKQMTHDSFTPKLTQDVPNLYYSSKHKKELSRLVDLRARQEAIRDFVAYCAMSLGKGPWARIQAPSLSEVVERASLVVMDPNGREEERYQLAVALAVLPETYYVLSDLLSGKFSFERLVEQYEMPPDGNEMDYPYYKEVNEGAVDNEEMGIDGRDTNKPRGRVNSLSDWSELQSITDNIFKEMAPNIARKQSYDGEMEDMLAEAEAMACRDSYDDNEIQSYHQRAPSTGDRSQHQEKSEEEWISQDLKAYLHQGHKAFEYERSHISRSSIQ